MADEMPSMKPASRERVLFAEALERDDPGFRGAYLDPLAERTLICAGESRPYYVPR